MIIIGLNFQKESYYYDLLQRLLEQGKVALGSSEQFVTTLENSPSLLYWVFSISDSYYSD